MLLHRLGLTWDALNAKWNEWILAYGPDEQNSFLKRLGMEEPNWRKLMLTLVGLTTALLLAISAVLLMRYRSPEVDEALRLYRKFVAATSIPQKPGESPYAFLERIRELAPTLAPSATQITNTYLDVRYGPGSASQLASLRELVAKSRRP